MSGKSPKPERQSRRKPTFLSLKTKLTALYDPKRASFTQPLLGVSLRSQGVRIGDLRNLAEEYALLPSSAIPLDQTFEENFLFFLLGLRQEKTVAGQTGFLLRYQAHLFTWAITDSVYPEYERRSWEEELPYLRKLRKAQGLAQRFSYVVLLKYVRKEKPSRLFAFLKDSREEPVYTALAWVLSEIAVTYPEEVLAVLKTKRYSLKTKRTAVRKIRDSYRISPAIKEAAKETLL
jgi:3-methyladenine DNA glycosylase AlkD